jgi:hypothetical protein
MYAAPCPVFWESRKMSPAEVSLSLPLIVTIGALKPGWVTKLRVPGREVLFPGRRLVLALSFSLPAALPGRATEKEKPIRFAPGAPEAVPASGDRNVAVTETRSPGENGRLGEKVVPWPAGPALR